MIGARIVTGLDRAEPRTRSVRRLWAAWVALLGMALCVGCSREPPRPPPSPAPELRRPVRALPADLDVALRVDLAGLRRSMGSAAAGALELELIDPESDPHTSRLLRDALARADTLWAAFRPGLPAELTDNVVVLRGRFDELDVRGEAPLESPWGPPVDLGADLRRYERPAPLRRSAPARIYALSSTLLVFVSEAEIDSVERRIEQRAEDARLEPPEQGTVSFAARVQPLLPLLHERYPAVVELLADAAHVSAHATLAPDAVEGSLEAELGDAAAAERATDAAESLRARVAGLGGLLGLVASHVTVRSVGASLVLDLALDAEATARLVGYLAGAPAERPP